MTTPWPRIRVLAEPDDTQENLPEDVRIYAEYDRTEQSLLLYQGDDCIVISADGWERLAVEVMGLLMAHHQNSSDITQGE